ADWLNTRANQPPPGRSWSPGGTELLPPNELAFEPEVQDVLLDLLDLYVEMAEDDQDSNPNRSMRSFVFGKRSWRPCYDRSAQAAQEGFFLSPAGGRIFDVGAGGRDVDPWKPPGGRGVAQSSVRGHCRREDLQEAHYARQGGLGRAPRPESGTDRFHGRRVIMARKKSSRKASARLCPTSLKADA